MSAKLPIVLDIETSGLDLVKCGIWQIGAIDLNNTSKYFLQESRIDDEDKLVNTGKKPLLEIIGKTEAELRDEKKQSQKKLLQKLSEWIKERSIKNLLCQNPQFDAGFLEIKFNKYGLKRPFHYRSFDLHNIAQNRYFDLHGKYLLKENHSDMGLANILKFCGLEDNRQEHNALEDCKLTGECFSRLLLGKNLFSEYSKHKIPRYLKR